MGYQKDTFEDKSEVHTTQYMGLKRYIFGHTYIRKHTCRNLNTFPMNNELEVKLAAPGYQVFLREIRSSNKPQSATAATKERPTSVNMEAP